jgi:hypothetical protein
MLPGAHGYGAVICASGPTPGALFEFAPLDAGQPRWLAFDDHNVALASIILRKRLDPPITEISRPGEFRPLFQPSDAVQKPARHVHPIFPRLIGVGREQLPRDIESLFWRQTGERTA